MHPTSNNIYMIVGWLDFIYNAFYQEIKKGKKVEFPTIIRWARLGMIVLPLFIELLGLLSYWLERHGIRGLHTWVLVHIGPIIIIYSID